MPVALSRNRTAASSCRRVAHEFYDHPPKINIFLLFTPFLVSSPFSLAVLRPPPHVRVVARPDRPVRRHRRRFCYVLFCIALGCGGATARAPRRVVERACVPADA